VLIDAARVLNGQFDDAVVHLSGAQLEMLRNLTTYLHERTTFVDTYHPEYYELPDDEDWDTIEAIVSDLEDKLMGNENTIWGYFDRIGQEVDDLAGVGDSWVQDHEEVPSGEVWVINQISFETDGPQVTAYSYVHFHTFIRPPIAETITVPTDVGKTAAGLNVTLREGDFVKVLWSGTTEGQRLKSYLLGYKMKVPE
jgi:hypothetical protein